MRLLRPLLPALLALPLLVGCTSSDGDAPAEREALRTPAPGALDGGPCALVADDVVDLGRATEDLRGVKDPEQADKDRVLSAQERVAAVAETAPTTVKPALDKLVLRAGLIRIQSDTGMLSDDTLDAVREAYDGALDACSSTGATPAASPAPDGSAPAGAPAAGPVSPTAG